MSEPSLALHPELDAIRAVIARAIRDPLERRKWNVDGTLLPTPAEHFWKWLVLSLLSSQQRYRKGSPIERLESGETTFPLPLSSFGALGESEIAERLHGFRFRQRIAKQLTANHRWLFGEGEGWEKLQPFLSGLLRQRNEFPDPAHQKLERKAAQALALWLAGVGPKQARNLLQSLGLTRYEIPLDSRIVAWLQSRLGWNIVIEALARADYYEELLDRVQASCAAAGVLPTLFDAAAFEEMGKSARTAANPTTCTGYVNRNGQVVIRNTRLPGTDNNQYIYQLACSVCGAVYGANGSDIHLRLCPSCQGGAQGLDYHHA